MARVTLPKAYRSRPRTQGPADDSLQRQPHLEWKISQRDGNCTVRLSGELDLQSVDGLESAVIDAIAADALWIYDLEHVTFIDSAGVGMLRRWQERLHKLGIEVLLANPSEGVGRVLHTSGLATSSKHLESDVARHVPCPACSQWTSRGARKCLECGAAL